MSTGVTPGSTPPRFDGFDVLARASRWDPVTRDAVTARLGPPPPLRFFTPPEAAIGRVLVDRLLAQDAEPRVPVLEHIDARLAENMTDGWHYEDMPDDGAAWRRSLAGLDDAARAAHGVGFAALGAKRARVEIEAVRTCEGPWAGLHAAHVWNLWMRYTLTAFYAHPWSWNEIGFGGPAYPVGYKALGLDSREPWERQEMDAEDPVLWAERAEAARRRHGS